MDRSQRELERKIIMAHITVPPGAPGIVGPMLQYPETEKARAAGADDKAIHDTVLIAAAFCMFNRYVDGLAPRNSLGRTRFVSYR
jgi:hypothetical protein